MLVVVPYFLSEMDTPSYASPFYETTLYGIGSFNFFSEFWLHLWYLQFFFINVVVCKETNFPNYTLYHWF